MRERLTRLSLVVSMITGVSSASAAPSHYLCTIEAASGFAFNTTTGQWQHAQFKPTEAFILRRLSDADKATLFHPNGSEWGVYPATDTMPITFCPDFAVGSSSGPTDVLSCQGAYDIEFDRTTMRMQIYYVGGFVYGQDNNRDTPSIEIGHCVATE